MDIRKELNKLNKATLKDLVVRHDLHYYIKKTGKKAELVEGLARVYEQLKGIHIFAKPHKMQIMPRYTKQQKEQIMKVREKKKLNKQDDDMIKMYEEQKKQPSSYYSMGKKYTFPKTEEEIKIIDDKIKELEKTKQKTSLMFEERKKLTEDKKKEIINDIINKRKKLYAVRKSFRTRFLKSFPDATEEIISIANKYSKENHPITQEMQDLYYKINSNRLTDEILEKL